MGTPQYSGNISSTMSAIGRRTPKGKYETTVGETYRYDQLERLKSSSFKTLASAAWSATTRYASSYSYDANGNTSTRSIAAPRTTDGLVYKTVDRYKKCPLRELMMRIELEGREMRNAEDFHRQIKSALNLPDYYGENLDALWDCLVGWVEMPVALIWKDFEMSRKALSEFVDKAVSVFEDAEKEIDGFSVEYR